MSNTVRPHPWDSPGKNTGVGCHFLLQCIKLKSESEVSQSCLTLRDPMDCSLPGSSIHGIFQAREWSGVPLPSLTSAYLWLLVFLLTLLIPACVSSNLAFLMMYYAYKLNKQGDNIQPWHTPFPIWNHSVVPFPVLTVASWPACSFLRRETGGLVFPSLSEFSTVCCYPQRL